MPLPRSLLRRDEPQDLDLALVRGAWPADCPGELVLSAPHPDTFGGPHAFFGDGMTWRLSLAPGTFGAPPDRFALRPMSGATAPHSLRGFVRRQIRARLPARGQARFRARPGRRARITSRRSRRHPLGFRAHALPPTNRGEAVPRLLRFAGETATRTIQPEVARSSFRVIASEKSAASRAMVNRPAPLISILSTRDALESPRVAGRLTSAVRNAAGGEGRRGSSRRPPRRRGGGRPARAGRPGRGPAPARRRGRVARELLTAWRA